MRRNGWTPSAAAGGAGHAAAIALYCLLWPAAAGAHQDRRPSEEELFGGPPAAPAPVQAAPPPAQPAPPAQPGPPPAPPPEPGNVGTVVPFPAPGPVTGPEVKPVPPAAAAEGGGNARDATLLGNPEAPPQLSTEVAPENPLVIGGQLYLRAQTNVPAHTDIDQWRFAAPNLIDAYFDARPNDRVRAFMRARVAYDPTAPLATAPMPGALANPTNGGAFVNPGSVAGFSTNNTGRGPTALLDQAWIAFDIKNEVFITAGKQHVRWGTGRFWTPTDYLHPLKRNPFDVFDARTGTSMLKVHVPWEAKAWNFYGFGVIEDPNAATGTLGSIAGAGRAEMVLGASELGLDFFVKNGQRPRFGTDLSFGLGDFDFYADAGLRFGDDFLVVERTNAPPIICTGPMGSSLMDPPIAQQFRAVPSSGFKPQVVGGLNYSLKYNDNDVFTLGGEYFYNSVGYTDTSLYPGLLFNQQGIPLLNFLYTGKHYAALFASLPAPYSWNYTTFTLSTIGNLSDKSFVTRLDYSLTFLTHLTFQAFAAIHYGDIGELRLALDIKQQVCDPNTGIVTNVPLFPAVPPTLLDLGVALLVKI